MGWVMFIIIAAIVGVFLYLIKIFPFMLYLQCRMSDVPISIFQLVAMQLRQVPTRFIIEKYIEANKANLPIPLDKLEVHILSGGNIDSVIRALISASRSRIALDFQKATAIDLAGRDVNEAVRMSVQPKVLHIKDIHGISKDGIELIVKANITVRANLNTMVGGAGEDTIVARICEGIVSAIGSSEKHSTILNKPEMLTQHVIESGLDAGTAFEIVSLDISDIDVGRNIGAHLKQAQAIADQKVAQARAEGRFAMAKAQTQENKAAEQEAKANLVAAEIKVPLAIADSFKKGKIIVKRKPKKQPAIQNA